MLNCSAYRREQKREITLFIAGWALIKQRDSGSCLLQHLSNRKRYKSWKQVSCPSESCSRKESWLSRQGRVTLHPVKSSTPSAILDRPTSGKGKTPKETHPCFLLTPHLLSLSVCGLEMLLCHLHSTDASWLGELQPNKATNWWALSPALRAAVEPSLWMQLKFSYLLCAAQLCLHSCFGRNNVQHTTYDSGVI